MMDYLAVFEKAERGHWGAYVPDLPGCTSMGDSLEECRRNIAEAIKGHVAVLLDLGRPVPESSTVAERVLVA